MRTHCCNIKLTCLPHCRYAVGGYDGSNKISTMDIFDSRTNSWRIGSPFSVARGYGCAVTVDDNLFYIGGVNDAGETIDTVSLSAVIIPFVSSFSNLVNKPVWPYYSIVHRSQTW